MKMVINQDSPLRHVISFDMLLRHYDSELESGDPLRAAKARMVLETQAPYPELREGFTDLGLLEKYKDVIDVILQDTFADHLSKNEIKMASIPYHDVIFNASERFKKIIEEAGPGYKPKISDLGGDMDYIMACSVILKFHYGFHFDISRPYYYHIPDGNGVMRHYRIMYNADFMEIIPTAEAQDLTQRDVDELLQNLNNIALWKTKFPPGSFISKGFVIANMFDITTDYSISEIKSELIANDKRGSETFMEDLQETFRSFFRIKDIRVGFATYNSKEDQFERVYGKGIESFILNDKDLAVCNEALCEGSYKRLLDEHNYFTISDVDKYFEMTDGHAPYIGLREQNIGSAIFAPIADGDELLGILEIVSSQKNKLNGVNATKLDDIMPYIVSAVVRSRIEEENLIDAVIQNECTTIHPSVYWRFREEAIRFIRGDQLGDQASFREIVFKDVFPLYGQTDIKDSSKARNHAIQTDLMIQLSEINKVLERARQIHKLPVYEELMFRVNNHLEDIGEILQTSSEQAIFDFVKSEVVPVFEHLKSVHKDLADQILRYESKIDLSNEMYYDHRRNYDESVTLINKKLVNVLDKRQKEAQEMFPHYFERYKTDGVEHNLYIGAAISETMKFNPLFVNNLRLWQLQVICEMENAFFRLKPKLLVPLDIASLILVYNTTLSIRFRMDEKRFDVDGTYNARYEVIKKRIDKSYIKGTNERLTQKGKIAIVYSQKKEELEYLRYIKFLKSKGLFTNNVEILELDGLQGVAGLKAIRVEVLYGKTKKSERTYTYEELIEELKS